MSNKAVQTAICCSALFLASPVAAQTKTAPRMDTSKVPAAPQAPDLTRENYIQQMNSEFRMRDQDGDGKISRAELERFERNDALTKARGNNQALFAQLDQDRNGVLTPGEFASLTQDPGFVDVSRLMQRFDSNRDQIVTLVEFRIATLANFDQLDADKDGVVTDAEMRAANLTQTAPAGR